MKIELGGGTKPKDDGFVNVDLHPQADIRHDLNVRPWPFDDDSVSEVYTSHCLEHLDDPMAVLNEIARICRLGAAIEIRVPAPASDLAMVWDHKHVFAPIAAINADRYFPHEHWPGPKRLKLLRIQYEPSILLEEFREELPIFARLSDQAVMKWFPRTCHECRFYYTVVAWKDVCDVGA